ncbi:8-amino-7-oxononanoate synthase [Kytococcus sp. Marseille-QA3725]
MSWSEHLQRAAAVRERRGLTRRPRVRDPRMIDLAGNDYLGLARDERVLAGAREALAEHGAGATASRLVSGTTPAHAALETELADWCGTERGLVLSSGYLANLAAVTALADRGTLMVADARVHASLHDALRLCRGRVEMVPHGDLEAVRTALAERTEPRAMVAVESVDSVTGETTDLAGLAEVCRGAGALLLVDEAHGLGVTGAGRGSTAGAGLADDPDVVQVVTLSKALGSQGGAVLGAPAVIEHLAATARPFIYDTALAPASVGAARAALGVLRAEPERVERLHTVRARLTSALGVVAGPGAAADRRPGAVIAREAPDPATALAWQAQCARDGVAVGCFRPPSVPDGVSRLRVTASAGLDDDALARAEAVLASLPGAAQDPAEHREPVEQQDPVGTSTGGEA